MVSNETLLETVNCSLRAQRVAGKEATVEQLHRLEGIRRLLLRVDAVHAVSWLWHNDDVPTTGRSPESSERDKATLVLLGMTLPVLRRRARRRGVILGALFRLVVKW